METMKISIDVNINLSQDVKTFLTDLFGGVNKKAEASPVTPQASAAQPEPAKEEPAKEEPAKEEPAKEESAKKEPSTPELQKAKHTLDELRRELAAKVNSNREAIKTKLSAFGARSLTTLAEDKYDEMFNFLTDLTNG